MKPIILVLAVLLALLQLKWWSGDGGLLDIWRLRGAIEEQRRVNTALDERNRALEAEVKDLKQGSAAIEERARRDLGMVKEGETFYQVVEE